MRQASKLVIILIVILGIGTMLPLLTNGFFSFHDNTQVERVFEMATALGDKMFPVRWVSDLGYGYGYPIFNFYGPFPYYIGGFLSLIGFNALVATKIMFVIGILFSGVTMFYLSKKYFGTVSAVTSSIVYMYFPYHAVNIYVRGAVGEFFAYAFLPIVFLGLFKFFEISKLKINTNNYFALLLVVLGVFLVSISHNLSIFMLLILLVPFLLVSTFLIDKKKIFLVLSLGAIALGLLLSSFYVVPAFVEMGKTNVSSQIGGGANFSDHFVCPAQLLDSAWGFGGSTKGCMDGLSFRLGKVNIFFLVLTLIILLRVLLRKKIILQDKLAFISSILLLLSVFLTLSISEVVWKNISLMQYIQYPWRFLNFVGLFLSILMGYFVFKLSIFNKRVGVILGFTIILLTLISNLKLFTPQNYTFYTNDYYTNLNHIRFDTSKISDEYLPSGFAIPRSVSDLPISPVELLKSSGNIGVVEHKTGYFKASYQALSDGVIHINYAYFPGWNAYVNNQSLPIIPTAKGMNIAIPKGEGVLVLKFVQTPVEKVGNLLTILAFFVLLIGIIKSAKN
jgi:hypothetical protein